MDPPFIMLVLAAAAWAATGYFLLRRDEARLTIAIGATALLGALAAASGRAWLLALVQLFVAGAAIWRIAGARGARGLGDEDALLAAALPGLSAASARHLAAEGNWVDGVAGETLTVEGEPVPHLHYLLRGEARVVSGGVDVGRCGDGQFIGEVTALSGDPATATVTLTSAARLWCITAVRLREAVRLHADVRAAVERAVRESLTAKLIAANRATAMRDGEAAPR